jgi:WD40 repeat protein
LILAYLAVPVKFFLCATFDEDGICYSGGENGAVHCWDQKGELKLVLKAHLGACTAVAASEGLLISTGKDFKVTVHSASKGQFEYLRQIPLQHQSMASSIDYMQGKILVGHDNGRICTVDVNGGEHITQNVSHHDGESWGLEVIIKKGTFLTCADDNEFHEYSIRNKKHIRSGKIWTKEMNNGNSYETKKIKSTASTLCDYPAYQQGRAIAYSGNHNHVAVSNNHGDIFVYDYSDFSVRIATLLHPREWCEVMKYSPDGKFLAVGAHDDTVYIYAVSPKGDYSLHIKFEYIHSSAITALDWTLDSVHLRVID